MNPAGVHDVNAFHERMNDVAFHPNINILE